MKQFDRLLLIISRKWPALLTNVKILQTTEEEKETNITSNNANVSIDGKSFRDYEQSVFLHFGSSLGTMRLEEDFTLCLEKVILILLLMGYQQGNVKLLILTSQQIN